MIHFSLFSGIGGFDIASEWAGWRNLLSCEINDFGNKVLNYYWPDAYHHRDIHTLTYDTINAELSARHGADWRREDIIITGGFPCQPFSMAGKRKGTEDDRHLWPQMLRIIREVQPRWVIGENVSGIVNWDGGVVFEQVQADLENEGYEVQAYILPACGVNAPHKRDRVWFVAYRNGIIWGEMGEYQPGEQSRHRESVSESNLQRVTPDTGLFRPEIGQLDTMGLEQLCEEPDVADTCRQGREGVQFNGTFDQGEEGKQTFRSTSKLCKDAPHTNVAGKWRHEWQKETERNFWHNFPTQPPVCGKHDGLSGQLDGITFSKHRNESIKAYGNAIVPQVAYQIFKTINEFNIKTEGWK